MPPPKNKGKGKVKECGSGSQQHEQGQPATDIFDVVLDQLGLTYKEAMEAIPRALRRELLAQAPRKKNGKTRLKRVHKKLYTLNEGTFMIRIMPSRDSPPEQHLMLLFRWFDLYYVGFHCNDIWYLLNDDTEVKPPARSQVFYRETKKGGIVKLHFGTSYYKLGGNRVYAGPKSFQKLYDTLMLAKNFLEQNQLDLLSEHCQMALPAVVFSEALRFGQLLEWVLTQVILEASSIGECECPEIHHIHFNSWGVDSKVMFETMDDVPPPDLAARLSILKAPTKIMQTPIIRGSHEVASYSSEEEV